MMYDFCMRPWRTFVLFAFGSILIYHESLVQATAQSPRTINSPVITITKEARLYLNQKPVNIDVLVSELKHSFPQAAEVYVRADRSTVWEPISQVLAVLKTTRPPIQARFVLPE